MSKKEFEQFMFNVQSSNKKFCVRCGNFTLDRITISVAKNGNSPRKLCNMCKECYTDMLDYLGIMLIISFTPLNFVQGFFISSSIIFALLVILILLAVCDFNIKGQ